MSAAEYIDIRELPPTDAVSPAVLAACARRLPAPFVARRGEAIAVHPALARSYRRVVMTDFRREAWSLADAADVADTVHWCALGGSFLADFGMDPARPRIFGWGLHPLPAATRDALGRLKGRDATVIPTAACVPAARILHFVDRAKSGLTPAHVETYFSLGPAGMRVAAGAAAPAGFVHDGLIQFILPGIGAPLAGLVERFLTVTELPLMGITSANYASSGPFRARNGGTHKNLDEIQANMGGLGIPILAGPVAAAGDSAHARYRRLHAPYEVMASAELAACTDLIPTSVTVVRVESAELWRVVRHGSLHVSVIQRALAPLGVRVVLAVEERLGVGRYAT